MTTLTLADLDVLAREWADLQQRQAAITDRLNEIKTACANLDPGSYPAAGLRITVSPPRRTFDLDAAVAMLPDNVKPACQKTTYDAREVKKYLAPIVLDACMKPGTGARIVTIS